MKEGKVKFNDQEYPVIGTLSIGRTADNTISFPDDPNISRNHAQIQSRGDGFYVVDLGSSNGTAVNGIPISGESKLQNGDYVILGNSGTVVFYLEGEDEPEIDEFADQSVHEGPSGEPAAASKSNKLMLVGAAGALGLALVVGGGAFYLTSGSSCNATAKIISPEAGDTIIKPTDIEVESENSGCVSEAVFTIDGIEFAKTKDQPFAATIDPKDHPDLADGFDHVLSIVLVDKDGGVIYQPKPVLLAFETREIKAPANSNIAQTSDQNTQSGKKTAEVSLIQVQQMSKELVKHFSGNFQYNVSNKEFLQAVQKKTADFVVPGYFEKASKYKDQINVAFVREQNLDPALGFYLAMSRSKFDPSKQGNEEGLFRMTSDFVTSNAYNGSCGNETISDPQQNCASRAAALYMKSIVYGVFGGDSVFGAAVFGKSPQDAGVWKASLPANHADIWNSIKTAPEREQIVRFFAAGIVAENPQKFGLKNDLPISELYKTAL